jgi:hypothetical protein
LASLQGCTGGAAARVDQKVRTVQGKQDRIALTHVQHRYDEFIRLRRAGKKKGKQHKRRQKQATDPFFHTPPPSFFYILAQSRAFAKYFAQICTETPLARIRLGEVML